MTAADQSAGRFVLVGPHLTIRLPHNQVHLAADVTEAELRAISAWAGARLRALANGFDLAARLAKVKADVAASQAAAARLRQDIALLRAAGCTIRALPVRDDEVFPRYRFRGPQAAVAVEITQADLRHRAAQLRRAQEAENA